MNGIMAVTNENSAKKILGNIHIKENCYKSVQASREIFKYHRQLTFSRVHLFISHFEQTSSKFINVLNAAYKEVSRGNLET